MRPSYCFAAPGENENRHSPHLHLSHQWRGKKGIMLLQWRGEGKRIFVPSSLMGEGQDDGEKPE